VVIHGGSWINGSQANMTKSVNLFYAHGWQVFNLSYRLAGATYSQQVADVQAAGHWITAHASTFHLDTHRGAVYGFSAGGQLAAVLGLTGPFRAIVTASGVLQPQRLGEDVDGLRPATEPATPSMISLYAREQQMMGCPLSDISAACALAWYTFEPEHLLTPTSPPMLIFQGADDPVVPPATATTFGNLLTAAHVRNIVDIVPGYGHDDAEVFASTIRSKLMLTFLASATAPPPSRRAAPAPAR
jgi:acetyl esterase/lipase